jgi:hypothetical protein
MSISSADGKRNKTIVRLTRRTRRRWRLALPVGLLLLMLGSVAMQAGALNVAGSGGAAAMSGTTSGKAGSIAPPNYPGCYTASFDNKTSQAGTWRGVPCVSQGQSGGVQTAPPPPQEGGNRSGVASLGLSWAATYTPIISEGYTVITFSQFSGETDSVNGSDAFSIQLNTNEFVNSTGQVSWVQFVEQNDPRANIRGCGTSCDCVWQNDLTQAGPENNPSAYHHVCVATALQTLSSTFQAGIQGNVEYTLLGCLPAPSYRCFWGYLIKSTYYVDGPSPQAWSVVAVDQVDLHSYWFGVSGAILGYGASSQAMFNHPTELSTITGEYSNGLNANTTILDSIASSGESNNLDPQWTSSAIFYGTTSCVVYSNSGN